MKRYGNLYEKIFAMDNIRLAHRNARKGKRYYSAVRMVDANPEYYFAQIHTLLKDKTFQNAPYRVFKRWCSGKEREIFCLPYFPDRIIHHCVMQVLEPIWRGIFIRDTYSSIRHRGIHDGVRRVKLALQDTSNTQYCLKIDVRKFYPSVDHCALKIIIRKKIKCQNTLWLLDTIIDSTLGIPIGNYLSQYFGNLYLSYFDHWMKESLRVKYYFRYCDDVIVFHKCKETLHVLLLKIREYFGGRLALLVKDNWQVFPVRVRGVDFLGYRFFHHYCLLRKSIVKRFKRRVALIQLYRDKLPSSLIINSVMSYLGWMKYANTHTLQSKYLDDGVWGILNDRQGRLQRENGEIRSIAQSHRTV